MKIELRNITEIKPYDKNPRINDDAVDAVAASIKKFGFRQLFGDNWKFPLATIRIPCQ